MKNPFFSKTPPNFLFDIKVHRSQFSHELEKTTYIAAMREIEIPKTCHLVHGLTTLWINGGRASTNGLYVNDGYAVIGDIRGHLEKYDRKLIAHETGHNLGYFSHPS